MSDDKKPKRRETDPPDPVEQYFERDQAARDFNARVKKAGGVKKWRHRHNEGGKGKP